MAAERSLQRPPGKFRPLLSNEQDGGFEFVTLRVLGRVVFLYLWRLWGCLSLCACVFVHTGHVLY